MSNYRKNKSQPDAEIARHDTIVGVVIIVLLFTALLTANMNEPEIKNFWEQLSNTKLVRYLLFFALGWAIVQVLAYFETVLVIFIFAAILAFLLNYPVQWIERFLPHSIAVIIVFLLSLLILAGLIATLGFAILSQGQQLLS